MEEQQTNILDKYREISSHLLWRRIWEWLKEFAHDHKGWFSWLLAFAFTVVLAYFDYLTIVELFSDADLAGKDSENTFAILFALCLEGIPFFTASFLAKALLEYKVKKNDKLYAWIGVMLGLLGLVMAWAIAWYIRDIVIQSNGGVKQYLQIIVDGVGDYNENLGKYVGYTADIFLKWSPIITSILAFLASWRVTAWDIEKKFKKEVDFYHKKFLYKQTLYRIEMEKLSNLRAAMWNAVAEQEADRISIPNNQQVFQEEVIKRIRRQLILNSITSYPGEIERFQNKVEAELGTYLSQLAINSTNPELLLSIDLQELIQRYDEEQLEKGKPEMCWDYSKAGKALEAELKSYVNNGKPQIHSTFGLGGL